MQTPATETKTFGNHTDLQLFLEEMTRSCVASRGQWMRDPSADWITTLYNELTKKQQKIIHHGHRKLNSDTSTSLESRWSARSELSTLIIEHWLDGKTLDQVLAKSHDLGHDTLPLGKELFYWYKPTLSDIKGGTFDTLISCF